MRIVNDPVGGGADLRARWRGGGPSRLRRALDGRGRPFCVGAAGLLVAVLCGLRPSMASAEPPAAAVSAPSASVAVGVGAAPSASSATEEPPASHGAASSAPPTEPGPVPALIDALERRIQDVEALTRSQLAGDEDLVRLLGFDPAEPEEALEVERARLRMLVGAGAPKSVAEGAGGGGGAGAPSAAGSGGGAPDPERTARPVASGGGGIGGADSLGAGSASTVGTPSEPVRVTLAEARRRLDAARLKFWELPRSERERLLAQQAVLRAESVATARSRQIDEAEEAARRAEEEQRRALEAARLARTEAARLVAEEYATLLAVAQRQAQFEARLLQGRDAMAQRRDELLVWRRRVQAVIDAPAIGAAAAANADATYVELRRALLASRTTLATSLSEWGRAAEVVPQAPATTLSQLPAEVDVTAAERERGVVAAKAVELIAEQQGYEAERAQQLMAEVEELNRLRLQILESLSPHMRGEVLGFGARGWQQAGAEIWQVSLTVRYHVQATLDWLAAIQSGAQRSQSALFSAMLVFKLLFAVGVLWAWRRRAPAAFAALRERLRVALRSRGGKDWLAIGSIGERSVVFLEKVRRPLEWLLLVATINIMLPSAARELLEVRATSSVLLWLFGGHFIVLALDALSSSSSASSRAPAEAVAATPTGSLRMRSLRLAGRAVVAFGLPLSLSELLVGRGTVYGWVFSTCWFVALPILLVIIAWWRPVIFERFELIRKPSRFEAWVLSRREKPANWRASIVSSVAAVAGGIYLFVRGAGRVARGRVLAFNVTRRVLAYLFRRDMTKRAQEARPSLLQPLAAGLFHSLGPDVPSEQLVGSIADGQVDEVVERIVRAGGGTVAIVGERGAGKTTVLRRIVASRAEPLSIRCDRSGFASLVDQLNTLLDLPSQTPIEQAVRHLDARGDDHALLIDDAHFLVRPMMGGLHELDRVLGLLRRYSRNCTWILAFDSSLWGFVERARGQGPLFDKVIRLKAWDEAAIVRLIVQRNRATEVVPDFRQLGLDLPANADRADIAEAARRTEANYYRLLWDYAGGNPGVALHFWRRSLGATRAGKILVKLFDAPGAGQLDALPESAAFALRALVQMHWASVAEVSETTNLPQAVVEDALRHGQQLGLFDIEDERYRIAWDWYRAVTRFLLRRHLLPAP